MAKAMLIPLSLRSTKALLEPPSEPVCPHWVTPVGPGCTTQPSPLASLVFAMPLYYPFFGRGAVSICSTVAGCSRAVPRCPSIAVTKRMRSSVSEIHPAVGIHRFKEETTVRQWREWLTGETEGTVAGNSDGW